VTETVITARKQGRAGRLTLNRPKAFHALNADMVGRMTDALLVWRDSADVDLIVIDHAEGSRGFCAGGDVRMLAQSGAKDGRDASAFFAAEYRLNTLIKEYPKPYVALMDGVTMGGGVGISVHGSHRIATRNTLFAMPESGIGLFPDVGGGWFLPRLPGKLGMWLALTGARLRAKDVLAAGIATHFIEEGAGLADTLCEHGLSALDDLQTSARASFADHMAQIDLCFDGASIEAILASLDTGSDWTAKQAGILRTKSPLTLKIALRQLQTGERMTDFRENMRMEYRIGTRLVCTRNFQEGVRAVLIDRDNAPIWEPGCLEDVTPALIEGFFEPLSDAELTFIGG
jgi:enoyl-CoA hydratase